MEGIEPTTGLIDRLADIIRWETLRGHLVNWEYERLFDYLEGCKVRP